jgi:hypothetical protein
MLQVDPTLTRLIATRKRSLATIGLIILLLAAMFIFAGRRFFKPTFPFIAGEIWWLPLLLLFFWLAILLASAQEGFLRRVEARRQIAVQGNERFLAAEQPASIADALSPPVTFRLHLNKLYMTSILAIPALVLFASWVVYRWLTRSGDLIDGSFWITSAIFVAVLLFMLVTFYGLFSTEFLQFIEVTDEGVRTCYKGRVSSISWSDAKLFAFYGVFGDAHGDGTHTYELSGSKEVVKWTWYRRKNRLRHIRLDVSFDEYTRQMAALNKVVAARTGLLLHDLRGGR